MSTSKGGDDLAELYRLLIADIYELAGASRRASEALAREVGQTTARWNVLSVVSDGPRSVAATARRLGLARQSVQRVANELVSAGALRREADPADARAPLLALTDAGREVLAASVASSDADRHRLLACARVSPDELRAARETLRRLIRALADPAAHPRTDRALGHADHVTSGPRAAQQSPARKRSATTGATRTQRDGA